ncbi:hypothetical protein SAMN05892883_4024 [Jatrophihabitans sp. GAS493]|uniref:hypothetical protein n=1 Tax=Jatrophihabitans sp. GAS493 TaxID=1907575 RepID=UPI000BB67929|nr:hypothetical protein [Jatrophihabitans sp. GAS493]SOD74831.1 hypothetical protein SAMN05892883_4024 [Jatrophihabitans sp. GAS493]
MTPTRAAGTRRHVTNAPAAEDGPPPLSVILRKVAGVIAPTTLVAALLYYFGYVTTYARYAYFNVDISSLNFSNQELALQSVGALYVPAAALAVGALLAYMARDAVRAAIESETHRRAVRSAGYALQLAGLLLLVRAVVGILSPALAEREPIGTTPACLGLGPVLLLVGIRLVLGARGRPVPPLAERYLRATAFFVVTVAVLSLFWLTNSFAGYYGKGQAEDLSLHLSRRPSVVLDTVEPLWLHDSGVVETQLPPSAGQQFRFRYRGLRLLVEADSKLFLIPDQWRSGGTVLVLPHDGSVRVQFDT